MVHVKASKHAYRKCIFVQKLIKLLLDKTLPHNKIKTTFMYFLYFLRINIKNFTEDLSSFMSCPPVSNITQKELNRFAASYTLHSVRVATTDQRRGDILQTDVLKQHTVYRNRA